jgi:pyruvate dehydrogenase kinase 2/3/4
VQIFLLAAILFGQNPEQSNIGCIEVDCKPQGVVQDAYENARWLCDQYYLGAPEMEIIEHNGELSTGS